MKLSVEEILCRDEEAVIIRCHDAREKWLEAICAVAAGEVALNEFADEKVYRLKWSDVYYFEIVDGRSFCIVKKQLENADVGITQQALAAQREKSKIERKKVSKAQRELEQQRKFDLRQNKRKEKHQGH